MPQPLAFHNGRLVPAVDLTIPVYDAGFVQGVTVAEQMRTFGGRLFRLERHLDRLERSLAILRLDTGFSRTELTRQASELVAHNHALLAAGDDLGLSLFVTPGPYAAFAPAGEAKPTVGLHTYPVPFHTFAAKYRTGEALVVTPVEQVPAACWPPELKCRSRMHYFLADRAAREIDPGARALLCDAEGLVTEASTANLVLYREGEGLISPPREKILPGITLEVLAELAQKGGLAFTYRELKPHDVGAAQEAYLVSTSPAILPVTRFNSKPLGGGQPGPIFKQLLAAWNEMSGIDLAAQAERFSKRG